MVSSGLLRRVALVRTTRRKNPEDTILHTRVQLRVKSALEDRRQLQLIRNKLYSTKTGSLKDHIEEVSSVNRV
jgi:hypothetical protein